MNTQGLDEHRVYVSLLKACDKKWKYMPLSHQLSGVYIVMCKSTICVAFILCSSKCTKHIRLGQRLLFSPQHPGT